MNKIFDDIIITSPEHSNPYRKIYNVRLSEAQKKGWFISAVFGSSAWCVKKAHKPICFKCRCVSIKFNCDREEAEKQINIIAEQKYLMYKRILKGKRYEG